MSDSGSRSRSGGRRKRSRRRSPRRRRALSRSREASRRRDAFGRSDTARQKYGERDKDRNRDRDRDRGSGSPDKRRRRKQKRGTSESSDASKSATPASGMPGMPGMPGFFPQMGMGMPGFAPGLFPPMWPGWAPGLPMPGSNPESSEKSRRKEKSRDRSRSRSAEHVRLPRAVMGRIIGKQGVNIKNIREKSGAQVNAVDNTEGEHCEFKITGSAEKRQIAKDMIMEIAGKAGAGASGANGAATTGHAAAMSFATSEDTENLEYPVILMGGIIGIKGAKISEVRQQSGAKVTVEKTEDKCKVQITGSFEAVQKARMMIRDLAESAENSASPAGTHPGPFGSPSCPFGGPPGPFGGPIGNPFGSGSSPHFVGSHGGPSIGSAPLGGGPLGHGPLVGGPFVGGPLGSSPGPFGGGPLGGQHHGPLGGHSFGATIGGPIGGGPIGGQPLGGGHVGGGPIGAGPIGAPPVSHSEPSITDTIEFPIIVTGRIIGARGAAISDVRMNSGAKVTVEKLEETCKVHITGTSDQIQRAKVLIMRLAEEGGAVPVGGVPGILTRPVIEAEEVIEVSPTLVGRVIGKGGEMIQRLQRESGAKVEVNTNNEPCSVKISGTREAVSKGKWMVNEVLERGLGGLTALTQTGGCGGCSSSSNDAVSGDAFGGDAFGTAAPPWSPPPPPTSGLDPWAFGKGAWPGSWPPPGPMSTPVMSSVLWSAVPPPGDGGGGDTTYGSFDASASRDIDLDEL